jgi:hypothetical protein
MQTTIPVFNAMLHIAGNSSTVLDMDVGPLMNHREDVLSPPPLPQGSSVASSLASFRGGMERYVTTTDAYYADPSQVLQRCKDDGASEDAENTAALLLKSTKEFVDIIENLTPAGQLHWKTQEVLSTEVVLLAWSSYLAFMRLFDSLFDRMYQYLHQTTPESYRSLKVKSVLRIGHQSPTPIHHDLPALNVASVS